MCWLQVFQLLVVQVQQNTVVACAVVGVGWLLVCIGQYHLNSVDLKTFQVHKLHTSGATCT